MKDTENGEIITIDDCLELLNTYNEENKQLKQFKNNVKKEITNRINWLERNIEQASYAKDTKLKQRFTDKQGVLIRLSEDLF